MGDIPISELAVGKPRKVPGILIIGLAVKKLDKVDGIIT